jgi:hypothetical protein
MRKSVKKWLSLIVIFCWNFTRVLYGAAYDKYVDEIVSSFVKDVQKEYGLVCYGSGGRMPRDVETIKLCFNAYQRATIDEAREMIVALKTKLVQRVNAHEKSRPFLREYPFTCHGADISIAFHKSKRESYYLDGSVALVCSAKLGKNIAYEAAELQKRVLLGTINTLLNTVEPDEVIEREVFISLLEESCEEAVRIVQEKNRKEDGKND